MDLELAEEAGVAAHEVADIVNFVTQHYEARQAEPEGEAGPLLGVDTARAQHVGVHHPAGQQFDPGAALAHAAAVLAEGAARVELEARLNELKSSINSIETQRDVEVSRMVNAAKHQSKRGDQPRRQSRDD